MGYIVYFSACQFFLQRHAAQSCARKETMMQIDVLATSSHTVIKKGLVSSLYGGIPPHSLHHHRRGPLHLSSPVKSLSVIRNLTSLVIIEKAESLQDFILWVTVQYLMCHHLQEFLIPDGATPIVIDIRNHFLDFLFLWLETESPHCHFQLLGIDFSRSVSIEEIKCFFNFLFLFIIAEGP